MVGARGVVEVGVGEKHEDQMGNSVYGVFEKRREWRVEVQEMARTRKDRCRSRLMFLVGSCSGYQSDRVLTVSFASVNLRHLVFLPTEPASRTHFTTQLTTPF